jgi:nitroimidazol reductase NimA-like FMN-containing flavoprotein (pyridoxamine 5'-phosphate oxidase superfamily)
LSDPFAGLPEPSDDGSVSTEEISTSEELPVDACWDLLRQSPVGRLAVVVGGDPDIFPINYVVDHGSVVIRTAAGTKLAGSKGRQVAFEADGYDVSDGTAWSVVLKGRAELILEVSETISAMSLPLLPWQEGNKPWFLRIVPASVTGRRLHVRGGSQAPDVAKSTNT